MAIPKAKVTIDGEEIDGLIHAVIPLTENAYWTAQLTFPNTDPVVYPDLAAIGDTVTVEVRDEAVGGAYTTLFSGTILFPDYGFNGEQAIVTLQCVGEGYALNMMNCAQEYGAQSRNPTMNSATLILNSLTTGIIARWVNKYRNTAYDSGYAITTTQVAALTEEIPYIYFPWKPVDKCIDDLCDLHTALAQSDSLAGAHWIVDHDGNLRVKRIGVTQLGWTLYYGDSQANATLDPGLDMENGDFQPTGKEANVILYYGNWRRPSNGDAWTETDCETIWQEIDGSGFATTNSEDTVNFIVGTSSLKALCPTVGGSQAGIYIPAGKQATWDFSGFTQFNVPTMNFYIRKHGTITQLYVGVYNIAGDGVTVDAYGTSRLDTLMTDADKWYHFSFPLGTYYNTPEQFQDFKWYGTGTLDWSAIDAIQFYWTSGENDYVNLDGFYFGDAPICRIARQEFPDEVEADRGTLGTADNPVRFKTLTDNTGKDDSLVASDDSGLMAQLAKAELLRCSKEVTNGKFTLDMIPDVLPGQYLYFGKDWRITKATHEITEADADGFKTNFEVTDDLTNSHTRLRYEDINKVYASIRPEWQDRQASTIKAGNVDIRITPLDKPYNV